MEANSEGENSPIKNPNSINKSSNDGSSNKTKRQMKTPFQLETLEKAYAEETYPSEATRAELSEQLGLSDRQLQMWFCHRRLKEKKENPPKKPRKATVTLTAAAAAAAAAVPDSPIDELRGGSDYGSGSGSGSGSSPYMDPRKGGLDRYYDSPQSVMELRAIACVEAQLGEPLREDGPVLGIEFDPLPPDAFGASIGVEQQKLSGHHYESNMCERRDGKSSKASARGLHEYKYHPGLRGDAYGQLSQTQLHNFPIDGSGGRATFASGNETSSRVHGAKGHASRVHTLSPSPYGDDDPLIQGEAFKSNAQSGGHTHLGHEHTYVLADGQMFNEEDAMQADRKRKVDETRLAREVEAHESRIRKELEKQDIKRRKDEERMKREMEKLERERRKEEERLMRERQREEERSQREQKREIERREKFLQKEYIRAEKMRQKEELRREREEAKRKVALERATARKIAKESMDLIEDEQLELMELAAAHKGLPSVVHLDHDTLQNLDLFRDSLIKFPPKNMHLKKPFSVQPWADSEENVGNLLMVWRFLITFADVLGLWPFTLDEFLQAFHDYDSRLLGEIHLTLLKLIIKDIEDVARAPTVSGTNQYSAANPEGGHPQIVQGAYAWGFDIRNWQQNLNQLTWPEVFRQLALAAGFGPQLKKRNAAWTGMGDNTEVKDCEDVVSNLRNGAAAENAFALMREKGLLAPRKSRHRLTPGTVKFAAFHVLSLEGPKGLTVIELAEKIQKSGLRDLTTSKTPEASISVALTRDTKLFERIAPSTYCVRAAYRKDPADAETILAAARKKIRMFENGFVGVGAGAEDADDVERDEDLEGDVDEDPEVDDIATPSTANKIINNEIGVNACTGSGKDDMNIDVAPVAENEFDKEFSGLPTNDSEAVNCSRSAQYVACDVGSSNLNQESVEIDESKSYVSWIQGLSEGEYSHLSVEERLNAFVALIGVANEGNTIRAVLEERMEAANALKKQMWAEAQVGSRLREEIGKFEISSCIGCKTEDQLTGTGVEGSHSPLPIAAENRITDASPSIVEDQTSLTLSNNHANSFPTEDNFATQLSGYASKRSRSQLKSYIAHQAEEMCVYRSLPLGQDRRRNRYWQFVASASRNDPCSGRIFVELHNGHWRLIDSEEVFDALLTSLDTRGIRESHLRIMLKKIETSFKENIRQTIKGPSDSKVKKEAVQMDSSPDCPSGSGSPSSVVCGLNSETTETSSCFKIELGRNEGEKEAALRRYQDFQGWMWKECFDLVTLSAIKYGKKRESQLLNICDLCFNLYLSEDTPSHSCQQTSDRPGRHFMFLENTDQYDEKKKSGAGDTRVFDSSHPLGIKLLKAFLALIEVYIPSEALESSWMDGYRKIWGQKLNDSSSPAELLKVLTWLEFAIKRNYLSSKFETTQELLGSSGSLHEFTDLDSVSVLPWIPNTIAAVALKVFELDASIIYAQKEKAKPCEDNEVGEHMGLPPRYLKSREDEVKVDNGVRAKGVNYSDLNSGRHSNGKSGRKNRDQGSRRRQKRVSGSKNNNGRRNTRDIESLDLQLRDQGGGINGQTTGWGRRTVRKRAERRPIGGVLMGSMADLGRPKSNREPGRNLNEHWHHEQSQMMHVEASENGDSAEEVESDDNAEEEYQENWQAGYRGPSNGWNEDLMEMSDDDAEASGDAMQEVADDSEGEMDSSGESDVPNNIGNDAVESDVSDDYSD